MASLLVSGSSRCDLQLRLFRRESYDKKSKLKSSIASHLRPGSGGLALDKATRYLVPPLKRISLERRR